MKETIRLTLTRDEAKLIKMILDTTTLAMTKNEELNIKEISYIIETKTEKYGK